MNIVFLTLVLLNLGMIVEEDLTNTPVHDLLGVEKVVLRGLLPALPVSDLFSSMEIQVWFKNNTRPTRPGPVMLASYVRPLVKKSDLASPVVGTSYLGWVMVCVHCASLTLLMYQTVLLEMW